MRLQRIDGVVVEKEERLLAAALAPYVAEALRAGWVLDTVPNPNAHLDMTLAEYQVWLRAFVYQAWLRAFVYQARLCAFVWEVLGLSPSLCRRSGQVSVCVGVCALHLQLMCMSLYDI